MREADRAIGKKRGGQCDVERKRRVIAPAESAADIRELGVDGFRLKRRLGFAQHIPNRFRRLVGRLRAQHQFEFPSPGIVPAEAGFRLEKHRVDGLGLEFALQHEERRIIIREFRADLLAVDRRFRISAAFGQRRPIPSVGVGNDFRTDPPILQRRADVRRVRRRSRDAGETIGAVIRRLNRAGFLAELHESAVAQRQARLIEGVELIEDQQRDRLTEIQRGLAGRTHQVAGIEFGNARADPRKIGGGHYDRRFALAAQTREVNAGIDMRCVRRPDQHGVRRGRRPSRHVDGAEVRRVELRAGNLGNAINAAAAGSSGIPLLSARQRFARDKAEFIGGRQPRQAEHDAARCNPLDELASRRSHGSSS